MAWSLIHWPLNAIDTTRDMTHTQSIQTGALDEAAKIPNIAILVAEFNGAMDKRPVNPCYFNDLNIQLGAGPTARQILNMESLLDLWVKGKRVWIFFPDW